MVNNTHNDHLCGNTLAYPANINQAYNLLINYQMSCNNLRSNNNHNSNSFSFLSMDNSGGRGRGGGQQGCGGQGRGGQGGQPQTSDTNKSKNNSNTLSDAYPTLSNHYNMTHLDSFLAAGSLPNSWILLDSCSTLDIVIDSGMLTGIHNAESPIIVYSNAGSIALTQQGWLGNYPNPVWYHPTGIANTISLFNASKHYRLTMDTACLNAINLHSGNWVIPFQPTTNVLYKYELRATETFQHFWSMVLMVSEQAKRYTKRQIAQAKAACRLQNIIMHPGNTEFASVAIKHLPNCSIMRQDIIVAHNIFGPNLGSLKGKTLKTTVPCSNNIVEPVPSKILSRHWDVHLSIDIMFIDKIPFFLTTSHNLHFGTVEALENRQIDTDSSALSTVVKQYSHHGFYVAVINANPEFVELSGDFPAITPCTQGDHVPVVECYVRTVKDRVQSAYCLLPFRCVPCLIVVRLVKNAVF